VTVTKTTMRERTVSFFEVVQSSNGEDVRVAQMDFPSALSAVAQAPVADRTWETDRIFIGNVYPSGGADHLLLHRVKDAGEWLSVMDMRTGAWKELESRAGQGYLETTVISFLDYGNIVGIMPGSTSAPTHKSLEGWLNALKIFKAPLTIRPLVSHAQVEKLRDARGASRVDIRIGSSKVAALSEKTGRLARVLRLASQEYGDINVTMTISVPRGNAREEDRAKLLEDLRDLEEVMPGSADLAKAKLVYADTEGDDYARLVEFVEHHITAKRNVPAVDDKGNSVRISSAVLTIIETAAEHEEELRVAADMPDE
jgi:hypothetical protein